ncbi:MAG: hypothetical protein O7G84_01295 [Gammaproteobacteria bacterium]|nr:hypothetical protein [Gammaproteobacteria bacterium]
MTAQLVFDAGGGPFPGSITLPGVDVGTAVTVSNLDNTGVAGWRFEILDAPSPSPTLNPLPAPVFTSTTVVTPDVKGHTVMMRLTTYTDVARTIIDAIATGTIRVRFDPPFDWVIPAAQESIESNEIRGWANDVNRILRDVHGIIQDAGAGQSFRVITPTDTKTVGPNSRSFFGPDITIQDGGDINLSDPLGDLLGFTHRENHTVEQIPYGAHRVIQAQEIMRVESLTVGGTLTIFGTLQEIATADAQLPDHTTLDSIVRTSNFSMLPKRRHPVDISGGNVVAELPQAGLVPVDTESWVIVQGDAGGNTLSVVTQFGDTLGKLASPKTTEPLITDLAFAGFRSNGVNVWYQFA